MITMSAMPAAREVSRTTAGMPVTPFPPVVDTATYRGRLCTVPYGTDTGQPLCDARTCSQRRGFRARPLFIVTC